MLALLRPANGLRPAPAQAPEPRLSRCLRDFPGEALQRKPDRQARRFPAFLARHFHTFLGGALRRTSALPAFGCELVPPGAAWGWIATLGWVGAFTLVYFLATVLGHALFSQPFDAIPFWPAAGIAAGILIVSSRRAYSMLLLGVLAGTVAANLLSDRSLVTSVGSGIANASEAALVAWLLKRWFGEAFALSDLSRIAGF